MQGGQGPREEQVPANARADEPTIAPKPHVTELPRRWLTVSLIAIALVPFSLAATVWFAVPTTPEPRLQVQLSLEPVAWPPSGGSDVRLMPGVRIHNPTDARWTNVSMAINSQFYFYSPDPLEAGSDFSVPLSFFRTSGNQPFRPKYVPLKKLTVYAQLPSGSRAIHDELNPVMGKDF